MAVRFSKELTMSSSSLPLLDLATVEFPDSPTRYVNRTQRVYIPIPVLPDGGALLTVPGSDPPKPIRKKRPEGRGFPFFNDTDQTWQGAIGDGTEGIVVNALSENVAAALLQVAASHFDNVPAVTVGTLVNLRSLILDWCLVDLFHKSDEDILSSHRSMLEARSNKFPESRPFGYWEVSKMDQHQAVYLRRPFRSESGPVPQNYEDGAIILATPKHRWCIDAQVFALFFRRLEGESEVSIASLDEEFPVAC